MKPRRRLFYKYVVPIISIVVVALGASGAIGIYFSYKETRNALLALQQEKAASAAQRIEQFVKEIEHQIGWTALPQIVEGVSPLELRRFDYAKLQRQVHAITEATYIRADGCLQVQTSRLAMERLGDCLEDLSKDARFAGARGGRTYFGPVYFRKETEPYMAIAVRAGREGAGVTAVEVNLKFMWEVIQRIRIGRTGYAYVVNAEGHLIAHPDISLVLQKTDLSVLPQVKMAIPGSAAAGEPPQHAGEARDRGGREVLTAHARIEPLGWTVFVEQPISEAYQPLYAPLIRIGILLLLGLALSVLASLALARYMVRPINALREGAQAIGAGDLEHRLEVKTGDELQDLAEQFNKMASDLKESYAGLERKVEERTAELKQALDFQQASGEILSSLSGSIADARPVFDAIVRNLLRLFGTRFVVVQLLRDGKIEVAALHGEPGFERLAERYPRPLDDTTVGGHVMASGKVLQLTPVAGNPATPTTTLEFARAFGFDSLLAAPMIREDKVIGAIVTAHREAVPFNDKQVALIRAFADQAVIAIENARLVNETREALERQTATAEILKVISGSMTDIVPVFDTILDNAIRLCEGDVAVLWRYEDEHLRLAAEKNTMPEGLAYLQTHPLPLGAYNPTPQAGLERRAVHVVDVFANPGYRPLVPPGTSANRRPNAPTVLAVPLLREANLLGVITIWRYEMRPFTDKQVAMVSTFAAQAVIAIENVRLFNETREALERQTATAEVLRVISGSPTDTQPVFNAILESASKLCDADTGILFRYEEGKFRAIARRIPDPRFAEVFNDAVVPTPKSGLGRVLATKAPVHIPDVLDDEAYREGDPLRRKTVELGGVRTWLGVPMLREGEVLGEIVIYRKEQRPFSDQQIALLQLFADQAVIAIENVRLFNETKEALERQTATSEILRVISSSPTDIQPVLAAVAERAARLCDAADALIHLRQGEVLRRAAHFGQMAAHPLGGTRGISRGWVSGRAVLEGAQLHIHDMWAEKEQFPEGSEIALEMGYRTILATPLMREGAALGSIVIRRTEVRPFSDRQIDLLKTFADQAVIAIENVRLFKEIQEKSAQLEIANKHKSDFLANMSHELRTPLNAIIGFSEVLAERYFGELTAKQEEYIKDIHGSGKHLLSLINDILDLSKIEAGRMDLELADFDVPAALENALTLVKERAQRHGVALKLEIEPGIGAFRADERKFKQIMLNLLSNAVKFTPVGGSVAVTAKMNGQAMEIAVSDTGVGIAPEDREAVFEEFRQVGRDVSKKAEGTGLGLALTRRFIELHGGAIRLESTPGKGSTFTFTLPIRHGP